MTGEGADVVIAGLSDRLLGQEREQPQPGGRAPAPGELVVLQSFLNTHFDLVEDWGADLLGQPERLFAWFSSRGLLRSTAGRPSQSQVGQVIALREGLREMARGNHQVGLPLDRTALERMNEVAADLSLGVALDPARVVLSARGVDDVGTAVALMLAIAVRAMIDGSWRRLKTCPGRHCGWVFYDYSRNNSSRWCSMAVCGGRAKARSHYRRRRRADAGNVG